MATAKQKRAVMKTVENVRSDKPKTTGQILLESGYSKAISTVPTKVTESKGFKELLAELLPEDLVIERHKDLLNAGSIGHFEFRGEYGDSKPKDTITIASDEEIKNVIESISGCKLIYIKHFHKTLKVAYFQQPDNRSRKDAIDMAYKVRGSYVKEEDPNKTPSQIIGDAVLNQIAKKINDQSRERYARASEPSNGTIADTLGGEVQA